jgi:hypothetical protein
MVQSGETDIVSPSVTSDAPDTFLSEHIGIFEQSGICRIHIFDWCEH